MKWFIRIIALTLLLAIGSAGLGYAWLHRSVVPGETASASTPGMEIVIPPGSSAQAIGWLLQDAGLDLQGQEFAWAARALGVQSRLKAGVYELRAGYSLVDILNKFSRGDSLQVAITLIEGWTFEQMLRAVQGHPAIVKQLPTHVPEASAILARDLGMAGGSIEGWIFPDTYLIQKGSTDRALFERAVRLQKRVLTEAWEARNPRVRVTRIEEALTMASLIERETQHPEDREWVSAVFHNRLGLNMPLQSDPTVIYAMGSAFDGNLRKADLQRDSPYNTYRVRGLPPSPIANPGRAALVAALNPAPTQALYFVAQGDGSSYFSHTLDQHNHAVNFFSASGGLRHRRL
ncbi:MAG: endolytic transglycosylase MltG [Burkholderiaceae bacterium]